MYIYNIGDVNYVTFNISFSRKKKLLVSMYNEIEISRNIESRSENYMPPEYICIYIYSGDI